MAKTKEVLAMKEITELRKIAGNGKNVVVNVPTWNYDVEFINNEVYLLEDGKELEEKGTVIITDDNDDVYQWLNELTKSYKLI